jgi:hypothetical protein
MFDAPEVLRDANSDGAHDERSDVYAYGILLYMVCSPEVPMVCPQGPEPMTESDWDAMILRGDRYMWAPDFPTYYWDLIVRCWNGNPAERPRFVDILAEFRAHPESLFPESDKHGFPDVDPHCFWDGYGFPDADPDGFCDGYGFPRADTDAFPDPAVHELVAYQAKLMCADPSE